MTVVKFIHILTVVSLSVLYASFDALPVNALSVERGHFGRDLGHVHAEVVKKRADSSKKCRPRPSSAAPNSGPPNTLSTTTTSSTYAPSSTSSSVSTPSTAPASSINSKIMYAFSNNEQPSIPNFLTSATRLVYNWKLEKYTDIDLSTVKNVEFVPTAHSADDVRGVANVLVKGYARYAKFLNEPDIGSQANVAADVAHQLWMQYFEPLTGSGYKLIGPAVTGGGIQWMKTFLSLCNGQCSIYALDFHYYGLKVEEFQTAVETFHGLLDSVPVWLTEVGCHDYSGNNQPCTQGVFDPFFQGVMNYVESTSWVEQVAWFGMFTTSEIQQISQDFETVNCMITCSGDNKECKPNSLGYQYINFH